MLQGQVALDGIAGYTGDGADLKLAAPAVMELQNVFEFAHSDRFVGHMWLKFTDDVFICYSARYEGRFRYRSGAIFRWSV